MSEGKSKTLSRITNGATVDGDGRSAWARRLRDVIALHVSDLGGADSVSTAEASIRRAAVLSVELERLEALFAEAGEATAEQLDLYSRAAGNLRRLLESLGLERRAKPVETLQEYWSLPKEHS